MHPPPGQGFYHHHPPPRPFPHGGYDAPPPGFESSYPCQGLPPPGPPQSQSSSQRVHPPPAKTYPTGRGEEEWSGEEDELEGDELVDEDGEEGDE